MFQLNEMKEHSTCFSCI